MGTPSTKIPGRVGWDAASKKAFVACMSEDESGFVLKLDAKMIHDLAELQRQNG
jgi:hypothetical protein